MIASAKHFIGYAATDAGQNMAATAIGPRELYDVYARPFEAAIRLAGLGSVMASYSEFEGVPIHISHEVLTKLSTSSSTWNIRVWASSASPPWIVCYRMCAIPCDRRRRLA